MVRSLGLQLQLTLVGAVLVLMSIGATSAAAWWMIDRQLDAAARFRLEQAVEFVAGEYEQLIENARITGEVLAVRLSPQADVTSELSDVLSTVVQGARRTASGDTIAVLDATGAVLIEVARERGATGGTSAPGGTQWLGDDAVETALQGVPALGIEPFPGGGLRAVAVLPVRAGGIDTPVTGAVAVTSFLDADIAARLSRVTGYGVAFYAADRPVASSAGAGGATALPGEPSARAVWTRVASGQDVQIESGGPFGRALVWYAPLRDAGGEVTGMVEVRAGIDVLGSGRGHALSLFLPAVFLVLCLGLATEAYAARALSRPLTRLLAAVQRIGAGDLATPVDAGPRRDEVGALAAATDEMRRRLAEAQESQAQLARLKDEYLFSVAHELRTPVAVLAGSVELLAEDGEDLSPAERAHFMAIVRRHTTSLQTLVDTLLDLGSLRSGRFRVEPRLTPVSGVIREAVDIVAPVAEGRRQHVEVRVEPPSLEAYVDPRRLQQLLVNLLSNACKYGVDGDEIQVSAILRDGWVRLEVADHGAGIPPDEQARLFDAYFRSEATSRTAPGVGLGLAIVKAIVDAHGGRVGVESAPGEGTRFWIDLPMAAGRSDGAEAALPEPGAVPAPAAGSPTGAVPVRR